MDMEVINKISVEPIVFLYVLAIFGEYTSVQDLIFTKLCLNDLNSKSNQTHFNECKIDVNNKTEDLSKIESQTIDQLIKYNTILSITSIFGSFIAGSYGDTFGRLLPLSVPPVLSFMAQILFIISSLYIDSNVNIFMILMSSAFICGLSGGVAGFLANSCGFISDITLQKSRTLRFVVLEANIFCGAFFGYMSAGFILKNGFPHKYIICFTSYSLIHLFILIYIWLRLTTFTTNSIQSSDELNSNPKNLMVMFFDVIKTVFKRRQSNNRKLILLLIVTFICVTYGTVVLTSLLFLFVRNRPLVWDTSLYAYYSAIKFGATGLALCLLPLLQHYFWPNICDTSIAIVGLLSRTFGLILIGLATNTYVMFSTIILLVFSEYPLPAIRSLLSKLVETNERGKVFAFLTLFHNLCSLSGGILFPMVYKNEIKIDAYSGLSFELTAILQMIAIIVFM